LQVSELLLRELRYVRELALVQDVSYVEFLDRVHAGELKLHAAGLWDVQHPWLHLFLPRSHILEFTAGVFTVDRVPRNCREAPVANNLNRPFFIMRSRFIQM
jgi:hypothetical protein